MIHVVHVQGQVQWEWYQDPSSRRWIAICRPLKLVLEADTHTELRENIEDSLRLFMQSVLEDGHLDRFLRENGWTANNVPLNVDPRKVRFDVPIELIARKAAFNDPSRKAH